MASESYSKWTEPSTSAALTGERTPAKYAASVRGDRDLKLSGYEVFRFGATELQDRDRGRALLQQFFADLFRRFDVTHVRSES